MAHFGWTWNYLLWRLPWGIIQRMLQDAPSYKPAPADGKGKKKTYTLTAENSESIANYFNEKYGVK